VQSSGERATIRSPSSEPRATEVEETDAGLECGNVIRPVGA
jgi:hypothetical protein